MTATRSDVKLCPSRLPPSWLSGLILLMLILFGGSNKTLASGPAPDRPAEETLAPQLQLQAPQEVQGASEPAGTIEFQHDTSIDTLAPQLTGVQAEPLPASAGLNVQLMRRFFNPASPPPPIYTISTLSDFEDMWSSVIAFMLTKTRFIDFDYPNQLKTLVGDNAFEARAKVREQIDDRVHALRGALQAGYGRFRGIACCNWMLYMRLKPQKYQGFSTISTTDTTEAMGVGAHALSAYAQRCNQKRMPSDCIRTGGAIELEISFSPVPKAQVLVAFEPGGNRVESIHPDDIKYLEKCVKGWSLDYALGPVNSTTNLRPQNRPSKILDLKEMAEHIMHEMEMKEQYNVENWQSLVDYQRSGIVKVLAVIIGSTTFGQDASPFAAVSTPEGGRLRSYFNVDGSGSSNPHSYPVYKLDASPEWFLWRVNDPDQGTIIERQGPIIIDIFLLIAGKDSLLN